MTSLFGVLCNSRSDISRLLNEEGAVFEDGRSEGVPVLTDTPATSFCAIQNK